jgi:hypothetical protein
MAALSADLNVETVGNIETFTFSANAADTFYRGAVVWVDTGGGAQATAAAGDVPVGICLKNQVIAAAGDPVEVCIRGLVGLPTALAVTDEGGRIGYDVGTAITDNVADAVMLSGITLADNDVVLGKLLRVWNSKGYIQIGSTTGSIFIAAQDAFV